LDIRSFGYLDVEWADTRRIVIITSLSTRVSFYTIRNLPDLHGESEKKVLNDETHNTKRLH
jgi:hypothetical protein